MSSKFLTRLSVAVVMLILVSATFVAAAVPPQVTYAIAVPDCDGSEWNLVEDGTGDYFANMYMQADPEKWVDAKLYLRYVCVYPTPEPPGIPDVVVYALVLAEDGVLILVDTNVFGGVQVVPRDAFVELSNQLMVSGDDDNGCTPSGAPPEFSWIGLRSEDLDGDGTDESLVASGWEASFIIPMGTYDQLNVETTAYSHGWMQNLGVPFNQIEVDVSYCPPPPASVSLNGFQAVWGQDGVIVSWETVSEVDSLGFNLYRAESPDGPRTQLNEGLIPSQAFGGPVGVSYEFVDETVSLSATSYYWLEDVDIYGVAAQHGPVVVKPLTLRLLPGRPRPVPILIPLQPVPGLTVEQ